MAYKFTPEQEAAIQATIQDFPTYAREWLKIRDKPGTIRPLILNVAQAYVHQKLEEQLKETGMVRAVVLKGRQMGMSSYIAARFYHHTVTSPGKRTYILAHEQAASDNLFAMAQRFHEHYPEILKPALRASNAKELSFSSLDSGYKVATAGNKGAGRSDTAQYVHGSEVSFWSNAESHLSGLLQTVPLLPGTEIVFESTACGIGNTFHDVWCQGVLKEGGWQAIFVPWTWQPEYVINDENIKVDDEDMAYGKMYDLTIPQLRWRRYKIGELGSPLQFKQEYPMTAAEAFEVSNDMAFMKDEVVVAARKSISTAFGPKIIGVDPARSGRDNTVIMIRQGRVAEVVEVVKGDDTMVVVSKILQALRKYSPDAIFIDVGGLGAGIVDRLRELGYRMVRGVDFGSSPLDKNRYVNKRAEMYGLMKEWVGDPPCQIPDDDLLQQDLCGLQIDRFDQHNRVVLESKDAFKKRFKRSPDRGDALALTFAFPVRDAEAERLDMASFSGLGRKNRSTVPGMG